MNLPRQSDLECGVFARLVSVSSPYHFGDAVGEPFWVYVHDVVHGTFPYIDAVDADKLEQGSKASMARLLANYRVLEIDRTCTVVAWHNNDLRDYAKGKGYDGSGKTK